MRTWPWCLLVGCDPWDQAASACGSEDASISDPEAFYGDGVRSLELDIPDTSGLATASLDDLPDVPGALTWNEREYEVGA